MLRLQKKEQIVFKKTWIVCWLIVFIWSFSFITVSCEEIKEPNAFIAKPVFTFNPVPEGKKITHDYLIENRGNSVLNIEKIKTG
jgi:hypothetical protein